MVSVGLASLVVFLITLAWLPTVFASSPEGVSVENIQTNQILAYEGGVSLFDKRSLPGMVVVSNSAIQPDLGIFDLNESGFVFDVPEVNKPIDTSSHEVVKHIVSPGETLSEIASFYDLKLNTILWANGLTTKSTLRAGKELVILPVDGVRHTVSKGETLGGIANKYKADSSLIAEFNGIDPSKLSVGKKILIPGGTGVSAVNRIATKGQVKIGNKNIKAGQLIDGILIPVTGIITQGPGVTSFAKKSAYYRNDFHGGVDIGAPYGTPVYAAHEGTVTFAGTKSGYGKVVYMKGQDSKGRTIFTRYGHLQSYQVRANQVVSAGEQIGEIGSTGRSTGPHLHFEIRSSNGKQFMGHQFYQQHLNY